MLTAGRVEKDKINNDGHRNINKTRFIGIFSSKPTNKGAIPYFD